MFRVAIYVTIKTFAEKCTEGHAANKDDVVRVLTSGLTKTIFNVRVRHFKMTYLRVCAYAAYTNSAALIKGSF